jgi:hypothetical protein
MEKDEHLFYTSADGDKWSLVRDGRTETITIKCEPNTAFGGQPSLTTLQTFLADRHGPQHSALIQSIRMLLHEALDRGAFDQLTASGTAKPSA